MVNRIWQYHFGRGLVESSNDFGTLGGPPSHPGLLDWLANKFVMSGWSVKEIHRLILSSSTYKQSSQQRPEITESALMQDPENILLWKFPERRLDAEQIRDSMLAVSGQLEYYHSGPSKNSNSNVRSIFLKKIRNSPITFLKEFDSPDGFESHPQRAATISPTQSLFLLNNKWPIERASAWADSLIPTFNDDLNAGIQQIFHTAYSRAPNTDEQNLLTTYLLENKGKKSDQIDRESLIDVCHMILTSNEFLYLD